MAYSQPMNKQVSGAMLLMTWSYPVLSAQNDAACVRFHNQGGYSTTTGDAYHVTAADVNGDSNMDFVVPGTFGFVTVFYGDGTGHFSAPANFPAGRGPFDVKVGDFNGDHLPDLAVADEVGGPQVLLNNGDGTFAAPVLYPTDNPALLVVAADFNRDGKLDLALATANFNRDGKLDRASGTESNIDVLLGNGDGTFQPPITSAGADLPQGITLGDFNEDGKWDLAISNYNSKDVRVLLGDGQGHFTTAFTYSLAGNPSEITHGDFNNDGHDDLAVSVFNVTPSYVSVYFGKGDGSFTAGPQVSVFDPKGLVAADFNNDGDIDLAVASPVSHGRDVVIVALGDGMGNFPVVQSFAQPRGFRATRDVAVADFDGNGRRDIVTAAYGGSVIFLNVPCH
jgi:hypothetical protein